MLERTWLKKNQKAIPHFSHVVQNIKDSEGVEITMNCNADAFLWILELVKLKTHYYKDFGSEADRKLYGKMQDAELQAILTDRFRMLTKHNCLNKLVTAHFLQISWIYERIWSEFFREKFHEVINACKISLSNLNSEIVTQIAKRVSDE